MATQHERDSDLETVIAHIDGLAASEFFGFFTLKFERGKVVHLREERNIRPVDLAPNGATQPKKTGENNVRTERSTNQR